MFRDSRIVGFSCLIWGLRSWGGICIRGWIDQTKFNWLIFRIYRFSFNACGHILISISNFNLPKLTIKLEPRIFEFHPKLCDFYGKIINNGNWIFCWWSERVSLIEKIKIFFDWIELYMVEVDYGFWVINDWIDREFLMRIFWCWIFWCSETPTVWEIAIHRLHKLIDFLSVRFFDKRTWDLVRSIAK
jgi:hypothetical protein